MNKPVRTRFAPSPTGYLHVGGVRTALFAWLVARKAGGQFILRIEDTDKAREVSESEQHITDSLRWLGLEWDEGPDKAGEVGPYKQSQRLDIYKQWATRLLESGRAYADPYSKEELDNLRHQATVQKQPFLFRNHRPDNPPKWDGSQPLRFKSDPKSYQWHDEVMGDLQAGPEAIDDFIIIKSDGYPTYNLAHIVDDHLMGVTHVMRSQEFLPSIPKFLNLYEALGVGRPALVTLPYVMAPDGKRKLSKRDGAKDILDYKKEGYLPEALVSFMATLGWNDGSEQEVFSREELIAKFSLSRVQSSGAKFDDQRLKWVNGNFIREMPASELLERVEAGFWPAAAHGQPADYKKAVLALVQERLKFLAELPELTSFFFEEPSLEQVRGLLNSPVDRKLKGLPPAEVKHMLQQTLPVLQQSDFSHDDLAAKLNSLLAELNTVPGVLFAAVRIAVTGAPASPELFGMLAVLGKDKTIARLQAAIKALDAEA